MSNLINFNPIRPLSINADPVAGAKAYIYNTGTAVARTSYSDQAATVPHAQPVVADGNGVFPPVFVLGSGAVRVNVTDANDVVLDGFPMDPVLLVNIEGAGASTISFDPTVLMPYSNVQTALVGLSETVNTTVKLTGDQTITGTKTLNGFLAGTAVAQTPVDTTAGRLARVTDMTPGQVPYATYGGTANAITLTTGLSLPSVPDRTQIRFRATTTNTAATTINVDGIGAVTARQPDGTAIPRGYIQTDRDTRIVRVGAEWRVYRDIIIGPDQVSFSALAIVSVSNAYTTQNTFTTPAAGWWQFTMSAGIASTVASKIQLTANAIDYEARAGFDVYSPALQRTILIWLDGVSSVVFATARDATSGTANINAVQVIGVRVG